MHLVGIFLEWFQNKIRNVEIICSRIVSEQSKKGSSRKSINACSRTVLEQTIRIFLKLSYNTFLFKSEKKTDEDNLKQMREGLKHFFYLALSFS